MIDSILSIIFRRTVKMACDIGFLYCNRDICDGVTLCDVEFNIDLFWDDHKPSLRISLDLLNYCIFEIDIYNCHHMREGE